MAALCGAGGAQGPVEESPHHSGRYGGGDRAGPIGLVTLLAAFAAGCARVIISDIDEAKLATGERLAPMPGAVVGVNVRSADLAARVREETGGWGADVLFECAGSERAAAGMLDPLCPGGCAVMIGIPLAPGESHLKISASLSG